MLRRIPSRRHILQTEDADAQTAYLSSAPWTLVGDRPMFSELDTPSIIVDFDIAEKNIRRYQDYCDAHNIQLRPHVKSHKLPTLAKKQLEVGAVGINCQKISEAEAIVEAVDVEDVLITYNIVGQRKLGHLRALSEKLSVSVVADSIEVVDGLSEAFRDTRTPLKVLVECDTGARRCGVPSPVQARDLAEYLCRKPDLKFGGLLTYPPAGAIGEVQRWLEEAKSLCDRTGLEVETVSSGGTPDMFQAHLASAVNEFRVGTYVYNDRSLVERKTCSWENCALTVLSTVVSVPSEQRAIIDAGSKVLTSDLMGLTGHGYVLGRPDITIDKLSEEHGRLSCKGNLRLRVGDRVRIIPNHACVVSNMLDEVIEVRGQTVERTHLVKARGQVW